MASRTFFSFALVLLLLSAWFAATCGRRRAIPPGGGGEEVEGRGRTPSPDRLHIRTRASTVEGSACLARPLQLTHPQSVTETPATNPSLVTISCTSASGTDASV